MYRYRHSSDSVWKYILRSCRGRPVLLVIRVSQCGNRRIWSGLCVFERHAVHRKVRSSPRTECGRRALLYHDTGTVPLHPSLSSCLVSLPCVTALGWLLSIGHEPDVDRWAARPALCRLIVFLICFRAILVPRSPHSNTSWENRANSFRAVGNRIRAGDNDDRLQLRFGE